MDSVYSNYYHRIYLSPASFEYTHGYVPSLDETVARIDAVGLADLKAYAEHMAVAAPAALALYGPVAKAPSFDVLEKRRAA